MTWVTYDRIEFISRPAPKLYNQLPPGVYEIYLNGDDPEFISVKEDTSNLINLTNSPGEEVLNDIIGFWEGREIFDNFSLPYRRGILLYGEPGCSKTKTVSQVSKLIVERGGYVILFEDVESFSAGVEVLRKEQPESPIVCVMEDIDYIVQDSPSEKSDLLNLLDGAFNSIHNVVYLATTNRPEVLEDNILNRPSRFDRRIEFTYPDPDCRKQYLEFLINSGKKPLDFQVDLDTMVEKSEGMSFAHLKELFIGVVLYQKPIDLLCEQLKNFSQE